MAKRKIPYLSALKNFLVSTGVSLFIGVLLVLAGVFELCETAFEAYLGHNIVMAHAVIIFGFSQVMTAIVHILEGTENLVEIAEEKIIAEKEKKLEQKMDMIIEG
ncbi:MAG: hypothetical protein CVV64_16225 [Candidatus Wallbacteria bacterium HGW-Wallbacteria-1]|uniref:Uncharacterized protein n=1 Tax=Candidatus Wallbacteria bacterium HGW-Wallbacteria-1 TaxID=2013854 RepID=A0A2N1PL73_9BACT|nr:MAG: hypothetical protein CVV64_16225 [Candidatus Wallbacteria bacterium HGW-Wallbacteria-1]